MKLKIFLLSILSILILIFGLSFYAYKKLSPSEINKMVVDSINKTFKNAKTELGEVKLNFGLTFTLEFKGLKIKNEISDLLTVDHIMVRIPFYSVLLGGGAIDVFLQGIKANYLEKNDLNNWEMNKSEGGGFAFAWAKLNIKVKELTFFYVLNTGKHGEFYFEEAELSDLNFLGKTRFKIRSKLRDLNYSMKLKAQGEIDLSQFLPKKIINCSTELLAYEIKTKYPIKLPDLNSTILISYNGQKVEGSLNVLLEKDKIFSTKYTYDRGVGHLEKIDLSLPLEKFMAGYSQLSFKDNRIRIAGKVVVSEKGIDPELFFNWEKGPVYDHYKADANLKGTLKDSRLDMKIAGKVLEGYYRTGISGKIDFQNIKKSGPFKIDVDLKNLRINPPVQKNNSVQTNAPSKKESAFIPAVVNLKFENVFFLKNKFSGKGIVVLGEKFIKIPKINVTSNQSRVDLSSTVFLREGNTEGNFNLEFSSVDLRSLNPFYPQGYEMLSGTLGVKSKGEFSKNSKGLQLFNTQFEINAKQGTIKQFNMEKHVIKILDSLPFLGVAKEDVNRWVSGDFETIQVKGKMDRDLIFLHNLYFLSSNQKIELKGRGQIQKNGTSRVSLDFIDKKGAVLGKVKKYLGDTIRFQFTGIGYELKPDYTYTLDAVGKDALKANQGQLEDIGKKLLKKFLKL